MGMIEKAEGETLLNFWEMCPIAPLRQTSHGHQFSLPEKIILETGLGSVLDHRLN